MTWLYLPAPVSSAEASEIMKSIGEAIQYLHSINIAHRDVKVPAIYTAAPSPQPSGPGGRGGQGPQGHPTFLWPGSWGRVGREPLSAPQAVPSLGKPPSRPGSLLRPCSSVTPTAPPPVCVPVVLTLSLRQCLTPMPTVSPQEAGAGGPDGVLMGQEGLGRRLLKEGGKGGRSRFPAGF